MYLKRHYAKNSDGSLVLDAGGNPMVTNIEILRLPKNGVQRFSNKMVNSGLAQGWLSLSKKYITVHCVKRGAHKFRIQSIPERECVFDGHKLPSVYEDPTGVLAREYVQRNHLAKVKAGEHHCGYTVQNYYETKLEGQSWLTKYLT